MARTNVRGAQIADGANGVDLTVDVTGTLPATNGGTGLTTSGSDNTKFLKSDGAGGFVMGAGGSSVSVDSAPATINFVSLGDGTYEMHVIT